MAPEAIALSTELRVQVGQKTVFYYTVVAFKMQAPFRLKQTEKGPFD